VARKPKLLSKLSDRDLVRRYRELEYHRIECALTPDHPVTRANRSRWEQELRRVIIECDRRGLLEPES
jgi:hypothetical protein